MAVFRQALKLPIDEIIVDNLKLFSVKKFKKRFFVTIIVIEKRQ